MKREEEEEVRKRVKEIAAEEEADERAQESVVAEHVLFFSLLFIIQYIFIFHFFMQKKPHTFILSLVSLLYNINSGYPLILDPLLFYFGGVVFILKYPFYVQISLQITK